MRNRFGLALLFALVSACSGSDNSTPDTPMAGEGAVIYSASTIVTMEADQAEASAVAVRDGYIVAVGAADALLADLPGAVMDETFARSVIVPGLIDPHLHMALGSMQYATPLTPPWLMATPDGMAQGLATREAFFASLQGMDAAAPADEPLVVYGYHDLVFGPLDKHDLDDVTTERPLIIWHYSAHDFYLNTAALEWANVTADLHERFQGVPLGEDGTPTGRVFEDAVPHLLQSVGPVLLAPARLKTGLDGFSDMLRAGGTTTVAELGYGIFGRGLEDASISAIWVSPEHSGYRLFLVPEHRAFTREYGADAPQAVLDMVSGKIETPAPVLARVKFFTDGAFYSQTMRLSEPGYLAGQSQGSMGEWVTPPGTLDDVIRPYWQAGLSAHIHSNGDAAQTATLDALEDLNNHREDQRFVIEHAGVFPPEQVVRAATLDAAVSVASHYVFFLSDVYQAPLGPERGNWISPLGSMAEAGVHVALHSDAPLAPPSPLRAASVHLTRATREGGVYMPGEALDAETALATITIDAAYALGLETEIGSIAPGKRADFTILDANPLETTGADWPDIGIWGVVLGGEKRPLEE